MAENSPPLDQDFAQLLGEPVTPVRYNRVDLPRRGPGADEVRYRRAAATQDTVTVQDGLSDQLRTEVGSEEPLLFAANGLQQSLLRKLTKGQIPWEEGLDLHGLRVEEARDEVSGFVRRAQHQGCRCIIIVHGKALDSDDSPARLKSYLNEWLRQLNPVLAFASATPRDGGTGAVYVLLRRHKDFT